MKYLSKMLFRSIHNTRGRYFALIAIVFLGVGFFAGLVNSEPSMRKTQQLYLNKHSFFNYELLSNTGFTSDQLSEISNIPGVDQAEASFSTNLFTRVENSDYHLTLHSLTSQINTLDLKAGRLPKNDQECVVDAHIFSKDSIGTSLTLTDQNSATILATLSSRSYTIVGIADSPLYLSLDRSDPTHEEAELDGFFYVNSDACLAPVSTEIWITGSHISRSSLLAYADYVLTRDDNIGFVRFKNDSAIVDGIATAFPAFFILIAALVCITTMTRMINEERTQIGTLKSMGVSSYSIISLYLSYSVSAVFLGCISGYAVGTVGLPRILWKIYNMTYNFAPLSYSFQPLLLTGCLLISVLGSIFVTWFTCGRELLEKPAALIRPKSPAAGKKIWLEHIPFFWNKLHFLTRIALRNTFRYKKKMLMTIVGISGCSALIVTGFGIRDTVVTALSDASDLLNDSLSNMNYVVLVLIICAAALSMIVLYNLTNINIMERTREIATVKVLGFQLKETAGYVLNENIILAVIGGLLGMPLGKLLHWYVLKQIVVDGLTFNQTIQPKSYFFSLILTLLFTWLSNQLMKHKIHQIPMAESLKAVE